MCEACATLLIYGREGVKLSEAFDAANALLLSEKIFIGSLQLTYYVPSTSGTPWRKISLTVSLCLNTAPQHTFIDPASIVLIAYSAK